MSDRARGRGQTVRRNRCCSWPILRGAPGRAIQRHCFGRFIGCVLDQSFLLAESQREGWPYGVHDKIISPNLEVAEALMTRTVDQKDGRRLHLSGKLEI